MVESDYFQKMISKKGSHLFSEDWLPFSPVALFICVYTRKQIAFASLRKKCSNTEYFWSTISCIGLNTGKYGPEISPYLDTFHKVYVAIMY